VHTRAHAANMRAEAAKGTGDAGGGYTPMSAPSYELALLSAGSALTATELVLAGEADNAHAMVRRSGHHAWQDSGYGFCVFNNCGVAARHAQQAYGVGRVAVLDIDAHHGNGTETIFLGDPSVLTISVHQDRLFPIETGSVATVGEGEAAGTNVNVNLPAGTGDDGYLYALERVVEPALRAFRPELLIVACGVDASTYDPLARLAVTARAFGAVGRRLLALSRELCDGRLVMVQEGGYSHQYAPFCWLALIEAIAEVPEPHEDPFEPFLEGAASRALAPHQREAVDETARALARYLEVVDAPNR
jgi:acetoin utilization deacetylase AcuC-like enzyme